MTDQEINIAIAEACGWAHIRTSSRWEATDPPESPVVLCGTPPNSNYVEPLPSYTTDLNAMHEAELQLTLEQWETYKKNVFSFALYGCAIAATARQRAKAFLCTIGKWREE